jgi:hypothetical protein
MEKKITSGIRTNIQQLNNLGSFLPGKRDVDLTVLNKTSKNSVILSDYKFGC